MPKRTAVIDIGSNSARMVVFEKTSHIAFHLIKEVKSRVRIGEGAYENGGRLQEIPLQRTYDALEGYKNIIKTLKCRKVFCVATSALRDAPNSKDFIKKIKKDLDINIKIIDGQKEAYYGGIAAKNLLMPIPNATTVDIGGGSTELALIKDGKVTQTISINLGTVRLKELFFDKNRPREEILNYISSKLQDIPDSFKNSKLIVIGGTTRSLSELIMKKTNYPLETVHGFTYELDKHIDFIQEIQKSDILNLKNFSIKKDRVDTIREGLAIFERICVKLNSTEIITSGAGVREGVYLCDLLRNLNHSFPKNYRLSLKSLTDRFFLKDRQNSSIVRYTKELFVALSYLHQMDTKYIDTLGISAKLYNIGIKLNYYEKNLHSFYFIINGLNYGFSHEEKILIALLIKYHMKKLPSSDDIKAYKELLPDIKIVNWLSFILSLSNCLHKDLADDKFAFRYENHTLYIKSNKKLYLARECIKKLAKPATFAIVLED
jgi:exopolyphosphatase/guanosine-5'-triphosphate,3'-diphosphate pyrophosphatase